MAEAAPFNYVGIGQVVDAANSYAEEHDGRALVVLCDHLTDAGNLGAISRSCEAVGASGLIIPNKRSARVEASTYKSSAGASRTCLWRRCPTSCRASTACKRRASGCAPQPSTPTTWCGMRT